MADTGNFGDRVVTERKSVVLSGLHGGISACKAMIWVPKSGAFWDGEMASPSRSSQHIRFAEFVLDLDTGEFWSNAGRIADEVISHLVGLVGSDVMVTLEIQATMPSGAPDNVVRVVTENSSTLTFASHGFEKDCRIRYRR